NPTAGTRGAGTAAPAAPAGRAAPADDTTGIARAARAATAAGGARWPLLAALAAVGLGAMSTALYHGQTTRVGSAVDLFLPWWTLREALAGGHSPYDITLGMGARAARFDGLPPPWPAFPYRFAYPIYVALFLAPVLPLPYPWAAAVWMSALILITATFSALVCHVLRWPATPAGRLLATLGGTLSYPAAISIILGQITALALLFLAGAVLLAGRRAPRPLPQPVSDPGPAAPPISEAAAGKAATSPPWRELLAGVMLACSTIKPQLMWLVLPLLLLDAIRRRRSALPLATMTTLAGLCLVPLWWLPAWPIEFLHSLGGYAADEPTPSTMLLLAQALVQRSMDGHWTGPSAVIAVAGSVVLLVLTLIWWWRRRPDTPRLLAVALTVTLMVTPLRAQTAQLALLMPCLWVMQTLVRRHREAWGVAWGAVFIAGYWVLVVSRIDAPEHWLRQLVPPLVTLLALAATLRATAPPGPAPAAARRDA
ncbi:MAG TPA: glycosyltransferase 87 family protein, partial [Chloroflexota bacterium]|nr:glycosyltransferase 87 family protein [Chloroflexota bacterium]